MIQGSIQICSLNPRTPSIPPPQVRADVIQIGKLRNVRLQSVKKVLAPFVTTRCFENQLGLIHNCRLMFVLICSENYL